MSATLTPLAPERDGALESRPRDDDAKPWSARRTVVFVVLVCGLFWIGVGSLAVWLVGLF